MATAKGYSVGHSYGASWLILWLPLTARWVRIVCDSATTSFTVHLLQSILHTASERTSVRDWLDPAACNF